MSKELEKKFDMAKSLESEVLKFNDDEKLLDKFIAKIVCSYLYASFDIDTLAKFEDIYEAEEDEEIEDISTEEKVKNFMYHIVCEIDNVRISEAIEQLSNNKALEGCWRL